MNPLRLTFSCGLLLGFLLIAGCDAASPEAPVSGLVTADARPSTPPGAPAAKNFVAPLSGREEVPSNDSKGTGNTIFHLSPDGTELYYKLIVANIENIVQAHIHIAAAGDNGPFVVFLYGLNPSGITTNGILAEGTITEADLVARPAIGFGGTMEELLHAMRTGRAYVNVHTTLYPGGEVRGQIRSAGPPVR